MNVANGVTELRSYSESTTASTSKLTYKRQIYIQPSPNYYATCRQMTKAYIMYKQETGKRNLAMYYNTTYHFMAS